jgi:transcriptional antiterminator Rof (Rho-off)
MVKAYKNAKTEYLRLHPEAHDMVLRYDPISHLTKPPVLSQVLLD